MAIPEGIGHRFGKTAKWRKYVPLLDELSGRLYHNRRIKK
jgi:hypothetical protein